MFFGLQYHNDNPGTMFTIDFADCVPIGTLYLHLPHIKDALQASEEKHNLVAEFDKATMEHFTGLIRAAYDGCFYFNNIHIHNNPQSDAMNHVNWLLELKLSVDNGLVGKEEVITLSHTLLGSPQGVPKVPKESPRSPCGAVLV